MPGKAACAAERADYLSAARSLPGLPSVSVVAITRLPLHPRRFEALSVRTRLLGESRARVKFDVERT
jgi:hypothetical protein